MDDSNKKNVLLKSNSFIKRVAIPTFVFKFLNGRMVIKLQNKMKTQEATVSNLFQT